MTDKQTTSVLTNGHSIVRRSLHCDRQAPMDTPPLKEAYIATDKQNPVYSPIDTPSSQNSWPLALSAFSAASRATRRVKGFFRLKHTHTYILHTRFVQMQFWGNSGCLRREKRAAIDSTVLPNFVCVFSSVQCFRVSVILRILIWTTGSLT